MGKRVWEYPEATGITNDDVILIDSPTGGSRSIKANEIGSVLINKTLTERGTFDAADDNVDGYKKVTVDVPYTDVEVASGPVASWDDGEDLPLKSLTCFIEPQQDLHGYDAPWVGGAGKNKLPMTVDGIKAVNTYHSWSGNSTTINNVTITIETDSDGNVTGIKFNGTASADITFNLASNITIPNGSYVWSNDKIVNISNLWLSLTSPNIAITLSNEKEKNVTVSNGSISSAYIYASSGNAFNNVVFKPMIRLASVTDATFAPYSNICPISGHTEANVTRCGKNLLASSTLVSNTYINQNTGEEVPYNGWTSTDYIPIEQNKWYRLLKLVDGSYAVNADATVYWACYDANLNFVRGSVGDGMKDFPSNAKWLRTSSQTALMNKAVLCEDSYVSSFVTESDYIDGTAYTVEFKDGSNPLTVYGGTLDVVSGELKVVPYYASYNGETLEGEWISDRDVYAVGATPTIGAQVVNIGATPITYQLTPTQVKSLLGVNNIWADTGDVDVEYQKIWVRPSA